MSTDTLGMPAHASWAIEQALRRSLGQRGRGIVAEVTPRAADGRKCAAGIVSYYEAAVPR